MAAVLSKFSLPFQRRLLQMVIQDVTFASSFAALLQPSYFESPRFARLFLLWRQLSRQLGLPPTGAVLLERSRLSEPDLVPVVKKIAFATPVAEAEARFIAQELTRYVRFQAVKLALQDSIEPLGQGDLDAIEQKLSTALQVGRNQTTGGELWFVKDITQRLDFAAQNAFFEMLIPPLDNVVKVTKQDLVVGLASPNTGKTFFLLWVMMAAWVQKKKVVFYTLEMSPKILARRMDSVLSKLNTADLPRNRGVVLNRVRKLGRVYGDNMVIKPFPMKGTDVFDIRQHLLSLIARGFTPDVVCIDYADLLRDTPIEGRRMESGRYFEISNIYAALKTLNQEFDLTTFTVSQARRGQAGESQRRENEAKIAKRPLAEREVLGLEDFALSYEKAMIADIVLGFSQTPQEKRQQRLRISVAKQRNEAAGMVVPITTNFSKGAFYRNVA
jgi:hypothetical protein